MVRPLAEVPWLLCCGPSVFNGSLWRGLKTRSCGAPGVAGRLDLVSDQVWVGPMAPSVCQRTNRQGLPVSSAEPVCRSGLPHRRLFA